MNASSPAAFRGRRIDIGGRSLRAVLAGPPAGQPLVVLEHGAFGCATDWASVQARLEKLGLRSLAYDRAGLGHSDAGPRPRDAAAMAADLAALLARLEERGPLILVGHSMGGLSSRLFTLNHVERVRGLVLVDAVTPSITEHPFGLRVVRAYGRSMRLVAAAAGVGLMRPVARLSGNLIGLLGEAAQEKQRIYGSGPHACWSAVEVASWPDSAQQAGARELPADLPVAVVTAGGGDRLPALKALQAAPAQASRHGRIEHVSGAGHASLLGERFADAIVRSVEHVLRAGAQAGS